MSIRRWENRDIQHPASEIPGRFQGRYIQACVPCDSHPASCDLFQLGGNGDLIDTGANITVYNPFALPVGGSVYILCKRVDGQWVVDAEDCG